MKGLAKMTDLRFLDLEIYDDKVCEYLPSSLRFMRWYGFPFSSLPNTFQGKHLVGLQLDESSIVQLWEDGKEKVLNNLRFFTIYSSKLRTFDLRFAPNLVKLTISFCKDFVDLHIPADHHSKLEYLQITYSKLTNLHLGNTSNLKTLQLTGCSDLVELQMPDESLKLRRLDLSRSKLKTIHLGRTPNLEKLTLNDCKSLVELEMPSECLKLKELELNHTKLRTLDLGLTPNLKRLDLANCYSLVEIKAPVGCLSNLSSLDLSGCGRFKSFVFNSDDEVHSLSELHLVAKRTDVCPLHSDNDYSKFWFECYYKEDPASSFGNLERLISIGLCACTNLENFSRSICSLQFIRKLTLEGRILEAPKDLNQLECLEELSLCSMDIQLLPDSICELKHLKFLEIKSCFFIQKLPEDIDQLESLETLILTDCELLQDIPNSICKIKRLNSFDLRGCIRVVELPEEIGSLEGLKELNIEGTCITRLPQSIFKLRGLRIVGSIQLLNTYGLLLKRRRTSDDDDERVCYI